MGYRISSALIAAIREQSLHQQQRQLDAELKHKASLHNGQLSARRLHVEVFFMYFV